MKKYELDKKLKFLRYLKSPMSRFIICVGNFLLRILPNGMKSNKDLSIEKKYFISRDGSKIKTYIVTPNGMENEKLPCLVYYHGGGFVYEGGFSHYRNVRDYSKGAGIKVVYVCYRLAPKYKFPIPQNDCEDAFKWVCKNADVLNVDKEKILVGGDSAGGSLTLGVTLAVQDFEIKPIAQLLIYPVVDEKMRSDSMKVFDNTPVWDSKRNKKMWKYYFPKTEFDFVSPLDFEDMEVFPKTFVEVTEFDPLRDEGLMLFEKLQNEKVLNETKKTVHGYDVVSSCEITKESMKKRIEFLKSVRS